MKAGIILVGFLFLLFGGVSVVLFLKVTMFGDNPNQTGPPMTNNRDGMNGKSNDTVADNEPLPVED